METLNALTSRSMPLEVEEETRTSITCYHNEVPSAIEDKLASLYGNLLSCFSLLKEHGTIESVSTYMRRVHGDVTSALIFQVKGDEARVVNEGMTIPQEEIEHVAE